MGPQAVGPNWRLSGPSAEGGQIPCSQLLTILLPGHPSARARLPACGFPTSMSPKNGWLTVRNCAGTHRSVGAPNADAGKALVARLEVPFMLRTLIHLLPRLEEDQSGGRRGRVHSHLLRIRETKLDEHELGLQVQEIPDTHTGANGFPSPGRCSHGSHLERFCGHFVAMLFHSARRKEKGRSSERPGIFHLCRRY